MSFLFGSSKSQSTIPAWVQQPAQQNIQAAQRVAGMGYTPYYGPDVAAMTPMQETAMRNTGQAMSAFGMEAPANPMAGMPQAQTFAGGVRGYSSGPMYDQALASLKAKNPQQYAALMQVLQRFQQQAQPAANPIQAILQRSGGEGGAPAGPPHRGGSFNALSSYLPGGVNTRNPSSTFNQTVARLTSSPTTVSASSRPAANPRR